ASGLGCFSPNSSSLLIQDKDEVFAWDLREGKRLGKIYAPSSLAQSAAWSPNGQAVFYLDDTASIFDPVNGKDILNLRDAVGQAQCGTWRPDGNFLAVGALDGSIRLISTL